MPGLKLEPIDLVVLAPTSMVGLQYALKHPNSDVILTSLAELRQMNPDRLKVLCWFCPAWTDLPQWYRIEAAEIIGDMRCKGVEVIHICVDKDEEK